MTIVSGTNSRSQNTFHFGGTTCRKILLGTIPSCFIMLFGIGLFMKSFFLAKKSLPHESTCIQASALLKETLGLSVEEIQLLKTLQIIIDHEHGANATRRSSPCWMERTVDSMAIIVVDALRFDFALYSLPKSIGSRLGSGSSSFSQKSQLFQFVADPPTVTMQRLKGLTTGGLPTFADISGSFGGASLKDDDTWIVQLSKRQKVQQKARMAFVGDDTWMDLFPLEQHIFDESHSFPSFNTRDLNTVDNGCMYHLPRLLHYFGSSSIDRDHSSITNNHDNNDALPFAKEEVISQSQFHNFVSHQEDYIELLVVHLLGVDHVGHTYGPQNEHMTLKLNQMDVILEQIFNVVVGETPNKEGIDSVNEEATSSSCQAVFVFGDHGMTDDGNHGGGTTDETHAALFVSYSNGCFVDDHRRDGTSTDNESPSSSLDGSSTHHHDDPSSSYLFDEIRQIDIVPTISIMLGLPIPYGNLGGIVPQLLLTPPTLKQRSRAASYLYHTTALAFNTAQVWKYLSDYDRTAKSLPHSDMTYLKTLLRDAIESFQKALEEAKEIVDSSGSSIEATTASLKELCHQSTIKLKLFLTEATELGRRVWTRFDIRGMILGIMLCFISLIWEVIRLILCQQYAKGLGNSSGSSGTNNVFASTIRKRKQQCLFQRRWCTAELCFTILFVIFGCCLMSFSNSYIINEHHICMFAMCIISCLVGIRSMLIAFGCWYFRRKQSFNKGFRQQQCKVISSTIQTQKPSQTQHHTSMIHDNTLQLQNIETCCYRKATLLMLGIVFMSRFHELVITGHGMDPSLHGQHFAHHIWFFVMSLTILILFRCMYYYYKTTTKTITMQRIGETIQLVCDLISLISLGWSWIEKHSTESTRTGYTSCRISLIFLVASTIVLVSSHLWTFTGCSFVRQRQRQQQEKSIHTKKDDKQVTREEVIQTHCIDDDAYAISSSTWVDTSIAEHLIIKWFMLLMIVTGPSSSSSVVVYVIQMISMKILLEENHKRSHNPIQIHPMIVAFIWRLVMRHMFFVTGHACSFNKLQFSSAFVLSEVFEFYSAGCFLFVNTFGWELIGYGIFYILLTKKEQSRPKVTAFNATPTAAVTTQQGFPKMSIRMSAVQQQQQQQQQSKTSRVVVEAEKLPLIISYYWNYLILYQMLELCCCCLSASVLRRHLMIWAIFAPRFVFSAILTSLVLTFHLGTCIFSSPC